MSAQTAPLPTPINPLTFVDPGRPAYSIATYNVRPNPWTCIHWANSATPINLQFQGEVVAIIPQDVPLNHKGIIFIASHGFQSDSAADIRGADTSIRRVVPLLAAGYTCFYINHGDLSRLKTEGGYPPPTPKVGWTTPEILQQLRDAVCFIKYHSTWTQGSGSQPNQFPVDASRIILSGGSSAGVLGLNIHTGYGAMAAMMSALESPLPGPPQNHDILDPRTALATVGAAGSDASNFRGLGDWAFIYLRPNTLVHPYYHGAMVGTPAGTQPVGAPWYDPCNPVIFDLFTPNADVPPGCTPPTGTVAHPGDTDIRPMLFSDPTPDPPASDYSPLTMAPYPTNWGPVGARFLIFPQRNFDRTTQTLNPWPSAPYPDPTTYNERLRMILTDSSAVKALIGPNTPNPDNLPFTGPVLWLGGADDRFSPQFQAQTFNTACVTAGIPNRTIIFQGEGHGFRDADAEQARLALAFISKHLDNKPDSDEDGMDDLTETSNITDPLDADTDGDGATDNQERLAGTNPTNPQSVFRITALTFSQSATTPFDQMMTITFPTVANFRYRLLTANPPPIPGTNTTLHGVVALRENRWKEVPGTSFLAGGSGSHTYTVSMPNPMQMYTSSGYLDALSTESRFFKVEVRTGNDGYLGVFTRPVGRFVGAILSPDPSVSTPPPPGKNILAPTLHGKELFEGKFVTATMSDMVFDANTAPLLAATDFLGLSYLGSQASTLQGLFHRYVVLVTHDSSRRPAQLNPPSLQLNAPMLSDHGMEGDWWPVISNTTTTANNDTLHLDTAPSSISVSALPQASSVVIRPTASFNDLFVDPFTSTSSVMTGQVVKLRRPSSSGGVEILCTYQGAGTLAAHEWDVVLSTMPGTTFRLKGEDIRMLPDEAAYLEVPVFPSPPFLSCGGDIVAPRAGYVPMRRINAYLHPQSALSGMQEFKGINYPVDEIELDSNLWGDINWSHLVESGLTGPNFTGSTSPPIASTAYIELDDVWRLDCAGASSFANVYLSLRFPIRVDFTATPNQPHSIGLWGYSDRPAWLGTPSAGDHTNTAFYWLPPEQQWFAFDRINLSSINLNASQQQLFSRNPWSKVGPATEYPLVGGRGIMTNLAASATETLRWVRPLTYPGDLRRDAR